MIYRRQQSCEMPISLLTVRASVRSSTFLSSIIRLGAGTSRGEDEPFSSTSFCGGHGRTLYHFPAIAGPMIHRMLVYSSALTKKNRRIPRF